MIPQGRLNNCSCGGNAFQRKINGRYQVYCHECENTTQFWESIREAAKEWNTEVKYEALDLDAGIEDQEHAWNSWREER